MLEMDAGGIIMEHQQLQDRGLRWIPRQTARDLGTGEWIALIIVALLGLTGILGTLATAWWLALT